MVTIKVFGDKAKEIRKQVQHLERVGYPLDVTVDAKLRVCCRYVEGRSVAEVSFNLGEKYE